MRHRRLIHQGSKTRTELGAMLATMLEVMSDRGPDSAGFAVYGSGRHGTVKMTVHAPSGADFPVLAKDLESVAGSKIGVDGPLHPCRSGSSGRARGRRARRTPPEPPSVRWAAPASGWRSTRKSACRAMSRAASAFPDDRARTASAIPAWRPKAPSPRRRPSRSRPAPTSASCTTARCRTTTACAATLSRDGMSFETENDTEVAAGYLDLAHARGRHARARR